MLDTQTQIGSINKSLQWFKKYNPEVYEQKFDELVGLRCKLRKIIEAQKEKPSIAAFGESQKGKSYLIGNLLQKQKSPFMVKDEKGEMVNFVDRVNPIGDNKEATGVVTRFTPFNQEGYLDRYHPEHPVIVKLFNVASIATILCDSYYWDLLDTQYYSDEDIKTVADQIYEKYSDMPELSQNILVEDDILDIRNYLKTYVKTAHGLLRSGYFEKLALVIRRVPQSEWASVLKYLWHENKSITDLFQRLVDALRVLGFAHEVYADFDAVMHLGDNKNTIMSVDCLNGLDDTTWSLKTNVYVKKEGNMKLVPDFLKCELCAICAETIFKIDPDYLNDEDEYGFEDEYCDEPGQMPLQTKRKLKGKVKKDLLIDTDLLDFPGARNRLAVMEDSLNMVDKKGVSNLVKMLLRGKVAYLFNSYNESRIINILLFCQENSNINVTKMWMMINDWVEKYVGSNARQRKQTISRCGGVSPLFIIGTKFNIDMIEKNNEDGDSDNALDGRWTGRFKKILYEEGLNADYVNWFKNWDAEGSTFKNIYLLRDYKYSGCNGKGNNLYDGFNENDSNSKETRLCLSGPFYNSLRSTFINNADVQMFFEDPALAWDVAATKNNDGALFIIDKLTVVAKNMNETRKEQFSQEMEKIREDVVAIMKQYLVTDDKDELLEENIGKADEIFCDMDFTCQTSPDYFGHLLQALQLSETESFKILHDLIPRITTIIFNGQQFKQYQLIRERCRNFEGCETEDAKWMRLTEAYPRLSDKEKATRFLEERDIDYKKLFAGPMLRRRNSTVIANSLIERWQNGINEVTFKNKFSGHGKLAERTMSMLVDCLVNTAKNVKLAEKIENDIAQYTDVLNVANIKQELVADIVATSISDFVMNFGYQNLTPDQIESAKRIAADRRLNCFKSIEQKRQENYDEEAITKLLDDILSDENEFPPSFMTYYNNWIEYMYVAFIAHLEIRDYNHEANNRLKAILDELK